MNDPVFCAWLSDKEMEDFRWLVRTVYKTAMNVKTGISDQVVEQDRRNSLGTGSNGKK